MSEQSVIVLTGATNGIGEAAVIELARRGARVGIVARSPRKAEATMARIQAATPGAPVDVFIADLALMTDVRKMAADILDRYERIEFISSTPLAGLLPAIPAVRGGALRRRLWEATEALLDTS
jgi:short-subunit dehydrogenase